MIKTDGQIKEWLDNNADDLHNKIKTISNYEFCKVIIYVNKTGYKEDKFITSTEHTEETMKTVMNIMNEQIANFHNPVSHQSYSYVRAFHNIYSALSHMYAYYYQNLHGEYKYMHKIQLEFVLNYLSFTIKPGTIGRRAIDDERTMEFIIAWKNKFYNNQERLLELKSKLHMNDIFFNYIEYFRDMPYYMDRYDWILKIKTLEHINVQLITFIDTLDNSQHDTGDDVTITRKALNEIIDIIKYSNNQK